MTENYRDSLLSRPAPVEPLHLLLWLFHTWMMALFTLWSSGCSFAPGRLITENYTSNEIKGGKACSAGQLLWSLSIFCSDYRVIKMPACLV